MADITIDTATQSNHVDIATEHVTFDWNIDFEQKVLSGSVTHDMKVRKAGVNVVIFDSSNLDISAVTVDEIVVQFEHGPEHAIAGSALRVPLSTDLPVGSSVSIKITYSTMEENAALQWLEKDQTQGKRFPYLFSQCQPIYARALAPLQDTPSNKFTYSAKVSAVLPVLLSAIRISPPTSDPVHDGKIVGKDVVTYEYTQPVPIPSYLIAIAVGNVVYRSFSVPEGKTWTSGIWAEPETIDAAHWEFKDATTRFLAAEEEIVLPYRFGVYDLLVLPPSFPYGGMENACLTFLTPTLITGDRSLVTVVVHELTHSWFGNGVTHANPSHFWLNEGWTTYLERLLRQELDTPAARGFAYIIGAKSLYDSLKIYEKQPKYQHLVIDFEEGEDPDTAYSRIPYEKGANFILYLERILGGLDQFLPYVRNYVATFTGKSITTQQWKNHLYAYWRENGGPEKVEVLDSVDWNAWFYGEGVELPVKMEYDHTLVETVYALAERWDAARNIDISQLTFKKSDLDEFNSNQILVFLERLQSYPVLPARLVHHLANLYRVSTTPNAEVRLRFYQLALMDPSSSCASDFAVEAAKWIVGDDGSGIIKGRMKFCRPVLRAVAKVDLTVAVSHWQASRNSFHPIARRLIDKDLGIFLASK